MKKVIFGALAAVLLSACVGTGSGTASTAGSPTYGDMAGGIAKAGLGMYINSQCSAQLNELTAWRTARSLMTAQQEREWEGKICGCVSEEAPNHLSIADGVKLATESGRMEVFSNVVSKTATACFGKLYSTGSTGSTSSNPAN